MSVINRTYSAFLIATVLTIGFCTAQVNIGLKTVDVNANSKIDDAAIENIAFELLNTADDSLRKKLNNRLKQVIKLECSKPEAFNHPFDGVKSLSILTSGDSLLRFFNWNIPWSNGTYDFECGILNRKKEQGSHFYFLKPFANSSQLADLQTSPKNEWIPCLYYELITKTTDHLTYYTLLGWDGNNQLTTKKYIDAYWLNQAGDLHIGAAIFIESGKKYLRKEFEYSNQNTLNLKFNSNLDRIEFDHLSPPSPRLKGVYEYYGADLSFDAFYWKNNRWEFKADIDIEEGLNKTKKDFKIDKAIIKEKKPIYEP